MHPDSWLEVLFGSRARVRILRVLCLDPARTWTERELAHAVRMSPSTVNTAIGQLRDTSILDLRRIGRTHAVRLREELAIVAHLRMVFAAEASTWDSVAQAIRRVLPDGVGCYLYGSTARRSANRASDVDILVVAQDARTAQDAAATILDAASRVFPSGFEVVALSARELKRRKRSRFVRAVLEDGLAIGPTPLEAFL